MSQERLLCICHWFAQFAITSLPSSNPIVQTACGCAEVTKCVQANASSVDWPGLPDAPDDKPTISQSNHTELARCCSFRVRFGIRTSCCTRNDLSYTLYSTSRRIQRATTFRYDFTL